MAQKTADVMESNAVILTLSSSKTLKKHQMRMSKEFVQEGPFYCHTFCIAYTYPQWNHQHKLKELHIHPYSENLDSTVSLQPLMKKQVAFISYSSSPPLNK